MECAVTSMVKNLKNLKAKFSIFSLNGNFWPNLNEMVQYFGAKQSLVLWKLNLEAKIESNFL